MTMTGNPPPDPWHLFRQRTAARIGLGRAGISLPTREVLALAAAHASARDAIHARVDMPKLKAGLAALGLETLSIESNSVDRQRYLLRPDQGRTLSAASHSLLASVAKAQHDIAIVIGDGLSARAVNAHALAVVGALLPHVQRMSLTLAPVVVATGARVALGDEIGALLKARLVAVLIGERPGLSSPDSLGIYLTYDPRPGRSDAERNCISNVRAEGIAPVDAAAKLAWLMREALSRGLTGVGLKDESDWLPAGTEKAQLADGA